MGGWLQTGGSSAEPIEKHGTHRQDSHGNWATGYVGPRGDGPSSSARPTTPSPSTGNPLMDDFFDRQRAAASRSEPKPKYPGDSNSWRSREMDEANAARSAESEGPKTKSGHRPLDTIAREIRRDWGSKVNFAAKPYLDAMGDLEDIKDNYGADSARSVVAYFLSNSSSWRGETAKRVKAELRKLIK